MTDCEDSHITKRAKLTGVGKKPAHRCQYFVEKKKRHCPQQVPKGVRFCRVHSPNKDESVPCPYDPSHTVPKTKLKRHLRVCTKRPTHSPWFVENLNWKSHDSILKLTDVEDVSSVDDILEILQKTEFTTLPVQIENHPCVDCKIEELNHPKHALQHGSLIGNLKRLDLLHHKFYYLEFGCGKADLLHWIDQSIRYDSKAIRQDIPTTSYGFGLIDRGVNRLKLDHRLRDCHTPFKRTRIDIKDLDLNAFLLDQPHKEIVVVLKHLCGVATDLTLQALKAPSIRERFKGMVVAMCCRHVCEYNQLFEESREYLSTYGISTPELFRQLQKVVSWAVDGNTRAERGLIARRIIDEARAFGVRAHFPEFEVRLCTYADLDITRENTALIMIRKDSFA